MSNASTMLFSTPREQRTTEYNVHTFEIKDDQWRTRHQLPEDMTASSLISVSLSHPSTLRRFSKTKPSNLECDQPQSPETLLNMAPFSYLLLRFSKKFLWSLKTILRLIPWGWEDAIAAKAQTQKSIPRFAQMSTSFWRSWTTARISDSTEMLKKLRTLAASLDWPSREEKFKRDLRIFLLNLRSNLTKFSFPMST